MLKQEDIASSSSPPPPVSRWIYDVFLSFRGSDTRLNFTDHLFNTLKQKGISTFRDNEELEKGHSIGPELLKAIEVSRYVIVVFSENYADSSWCLDELSKAVECMELMGQTILPVFYHVNPFEVRRQSGSFERAFAKHETRSKNNPEKVKRWRAALKVVSSLSGWHLKDRAESEAVHEIVRHVFNRLSNETIPSRHCPELVGIDSRVNDLLTYLHIDDLNKVCTIGILGMGGSGKTTLAQEVCDRIRGQFEAYSFLSKVRELSGKERGLVDLQKQLIADILMESNVNLHSSKMGIDIMSQRFRTKRVLIILDDVNESKQLKALCDHRWLGPGSRVIITSRDRQLLRTHGIGVESIYHVRLLNDVEALQLFSRKSFKKDQVEEDFLELSKKVLKYVNGLPLAIEVLGSSLFDKDLRVWTSALDRLKGNPTDEVVNVLKISFDALQGTEKRVFLDIACFFKGEDKDRVIRILESSFGYSPDIDVEVLLDKSLISLCGRKVDMHDRIQELGWEIVRGQKPYKHTRWWLPKDIIHLLKHNGGTTATEAILLDSPQQENVHLNVDPFWKMSKLRLLKIKNVYLFGDIKCLSNELQLLEWHACPLHSLPSDFHTDKLVELIMQSSFIKELWRGNKQWRMLRFIDMSYSEYLKKTPDFTEVPNLETLVLEGCIRLVEVHPSVGVLKKLILWNMDKCKAVKRLPPFLRLESLTTLTLSDCSKLKKFPEIEGYMDRLLELHLNGTAIEELPQSIDRLTGLTILNLEDCRNLFHLPTTIRTLNSLKRLMLTGCSQLSDIPDDLSCVECLEELDISGTAIRDLSRIEVMKNLKSLSLKGNSNSPPKSFHSVILSCLGMVKSSDAPSRLLLPTSFSGLSSLTKLTLSGCDITDGALPNDLGNLVFLTNLNLSDNRFVYLPESISRLSKLESLAVRNCSKLLELPKNLPLSLRKVNAEDCQSLTDYPDQFKVWTSIASGMTSVSSLILSKHQANPVSLSTGGKVLQMWIASIFPGRSIFSSTFLSEDNNQAWKPVEDFSLPNQLLQKQLATLDYKSTTLSSGCHEDEIPKWFGNVDMGNCIGIRISPQLKDDEQWMGVSVVFLVKGHPPVSEIEPETSAYFYKCTVGTEDFQVDPVLLYWNKYLGSIRFSSHFLLFFYVPSQSFPKSLNESRLMWAIFDTNNPFMEVQKCGIRLLYEQGVAGFIQTYMPPTFGVGRGQNIDKVIFPLPAEAEIVDGASIDSRWLNPQIGGTLRWERIIPTEGSTFQLRRTIQSILSRYLQELKQSSQHYDFLTRGCPAWFNPEVGDQVLIQLPPRENLLKNKKWMGLALCVSFVADKNTVQDDYQCSCRLERGRSHAVGFNLSLDCRTFMMSGTHQLLVLYLPRAVIPEPFVQTPSEEICATYTTRSPGVRVELCGLRVLYQQDLPAFVQAITHCIFRSLGAPPSEIHTKLIKDWLSLIRLRSHQVHISHEGGSSYQQGTKFESICENLDWSTEDLACTFPGIEVPEWFMNVGKSDAAQIQLSPSLFYEGSWMGVAVCASVSIYERPKIVLDTPRSESTHQDLFCFLDPDITNVGNLRFTFPRDNKLWSHACNFICFLYLPRARFPDSWNQITALKATIGSGSSGVGVHNCTIRQVFEADVKDLVEMLTRCHLTAHCPHREESQEHSQKRIEDTIKH